MHMISVVQCDYFILNLKLDTFELWPVQQCLIIYTVRKQVSKCHSNICLIILGAFCFYLCSWKRIFPHKGGWHRAYIITLQMGLSVSDNQEIDTSKMSTQTELNVSLQLKSHLSSMISICISLGTSEGVTVEGLQNSSNLLCESENNIPIPLRFCWNMPRARFKPFKPSGQWTVCSTSLV